MAKNVKEKYSPGFFEEMECVKIMEWCTLDNNNT